MKMEVTRYVEQKEMVDIDLPFYFKRESMSDNYDTVIYGKIEDNRCTSIEISPNFGVSAYELIIEDKPASMCGDYLKEKYKSSEAEYLEAKAKFLVAIQAA